MPDGRAGCAHELHTVVIVVLWLAEERVHKGARGDVPAAAVERHSLQVIGDQRQVKQTVSVAECACVRRYPGRASDWSTEKITTDLSLTARQWLCTGGLSQRSIWSPPTLLPERVVGQDAAHCPSRPATLLPPTAVIVVLLILCAIVSSRASHHVGHLGQV